MAKREPYHHGTYYSWCDLRKRCNSPKNKNYPNYGGRGIKVCPEWDRYEQFLSDMGEMPPGYSIERIDVNGNYCKENCKWIPLKDQYKNKRVSVKGKNNTGRGYHALCQERGINYNTFMDRIGIRTRMSIEDALNTPLKRKPKTKRESEVSNG